jgi:hypothetical protein
MLVRGGYTYSGRLQPDTLPVGPARDEPARSEEGHGMSTHFGRRGARARTLGGLAARVGGLLLAAHAVCPPAHARPTSIPPANQPLVGPQATLESFAQAYRRLSADDVVSHFTADYRFHILGDSLLQFVSGFGRDQESNTIHNMLHGLVKGADTLMAPVDSVGMQMDGFLEAVDPEHPDSTQHYRVVVLARFEFGIRARGQRMLSVSSQHVFHLVRGDVASLVAGQPATADRWYIRRWLEDVAGVRERLERERGECGDPPSPAAGPRSQADTPIAVTALAIRPLLNPACARLEVTCDLPGAEPARIEVYDVAGRLVNRREVAVAAAGRVTLRAGEGAKLLPGVYWVRLGQAARPPSTRMVVVAR